jgi:hypothetical protein
MQDAILKLQFAVARLEQRVEELEMQRERDEVAAQQRMARLSSRMLDAVSSRGGE